MGHPAISSQALRDMHYSCTPHCLAAPPRPTADGAFLLSSLASPAPRPGVGTAFTSMHIFWWPSKIQGRTRGLGFCFPRR